MYRVPDAVLGWKLKPNTSYLYRMEEATVQVSYNSDGWRDVEHTKGRETPEILRIAVLGDSFMEAYSVGNNDYFARQLENLFNKETAKVEVFNFGVGGFGPLQYYLTFMHAAKRFKPNLVLAGIYLGNDIINLDPELDSTQADGLKADSRPFLDSQDQHQFKIHVYNYDRAVRNYKFRRVFLSSALIRTFHREYKETIVPYFSRQEEKTKKIGAHSNSDTCKAYAGAWETFERILLKLKSETAKTNATLVIFSVPEIDFLNLPKESSCGVPARENLSQLTTKTGIHYIDLYSDFKNEVSKNGVASVFRLNDHHWNEKGHALAAQVMYKALRDRELIH